MTITRNSTIQRLHNFILFSGNDKQCAKCYCFYFLRWEDKKTSPEKSSGLSPSAQLIIQSEPKQQHMWPWNVSHAVQGSTWSKAFQSQVLRAPVRHSGFPVVSCYSPSFCFHLSGSFCTEAAWHFPLVLSCVGRCSVAERTFHVGPNDTCFPSIQSTTLENKQTNQKATKATKATVFPLWGRFSKIHLKVEFPP